MGMHDRGPNMRINRKFTVFAAALAAWLSHSTVLAQSTSGAARVSPIEVSSLPHPGTNVRWARAEVESLMDSLNEGADADLVRKHVVDLAFEHNLVTRFTSLVAVEELPTAQGPSLPQGGTDRRLRLLLGIALALLGLSGWILLRVDG